MKLSDRKKLDLQVLFLKPEKPQLSHYSLFSWELRKLEICECLKSEELSPHSDLS